ncbi:hypothetical protein AB0395_22165 [Streptosporangium sp. NPDC051023]|uniref:hypothetical protein n=1 Tax=Streptosporangium sp. NPDC051023 TaxID=3155410 RepID=UPI00344C9618
MNDLEKITAVGQRRREAAAHLNEAAVPLRAAQLAAARAGATPSEIAKAALEAVSRQSVTKYLTQQGEDAAHVAWQEAGCPTKYEALATVETAAAPCLPRLRELSEIIDNLTMLMRQALDDGIAPTQIADACGFANRAAWVYIAAIRLEQDVRRALKAAGLTDVPTSDGCGADAVLIRRDRTVVSLTIIGWEKAWAHGTEAIDREIEKVAGQVVEALATIGASISESSLPGLAKGYTVTVRRDHA